mgnify:CR=1 FL=1
MITKTAAVHAKAWKQVFDTFLVAHKSHELFDPVKDYDLYVDGKPRETGVRDFLAARHIPADDRTVEQIAEQKDRLFLETIHKEGVQTYEGSIRYIEHARAAGLELAVVSSSKHTTEVLHAAHLEGLFDAQMDGIIAEQENLKGKPAPDTYLRAARMLNTKASDAAVYKDALAGVEAGRAGGFGLVVGVDRANQAEALRKHGADIVVEDLADLIATTA